MFDSCSQLPTAIYRLALFQETAIEIDPLILFKAKVFDRKETEQKVIAPLKVIGWVLLVNMQSYFCY